MNVIAKGRGGGRFRSGRLERGIGRTEEFCRSDAEEPRTDARVNGDLDAQSEWRASAGDYVVEYKLRDITGPKTVVFSRPFKIAD
jgi:hypothetical protein